MLTYNPYELLTLTGPEGDSFREATAFYRERKAYALEAAEEARDAAKLCGDAAAYLYRAQRSAAEELLKRNAEAAAKVDASQERAFLWVVAMLLTLPAFHLLSLLHLVR